MQLEGQVTGRLARFDEAKKKALLSAYRHSAQIIVDILIIAVLLTLFIGTARVFGTLFTALIRSSFETAFYRILEEVMLLFVFVELFRVLIEYFKEERVKITYIADATIVFLLKEIWVRFTAKPVGLTEALVLAAMLLAVGAIRFSAVWRSPGE